MNKKYKYKKQLKIFEIKKNLKYIKNNKDNIDLKALLRDCSEANYAYPYKFKELLNYLKNNKSYNYFKIKQIVIKFKLY